MRRGKKQNKTQKSPNRDKAQLSLLRKVGVVRAKARRSERSLTPEEELMSENCRLSRRSRFSSGDALAFSSTFRMVSSGLEANLRAASLELKT